MSVDSLMCCSVNVHVHFPGTQPDELDIELDSDVEDIGIGLTDDARVRKSAQLTEIIPKVLAKYTPLKSEYCFQLSCPAHTHSRRCKGCT